MPSDVAALTEEQFDAHVQEKAITHLEACLEALDGDESQSPAIAPFDGCPVCVVREILTVCWNEMWERALSQAREEVNDEHRRHPGAGRDR